MSVRWTVAWIAALALAGCAATGAPSDTDVAGDTDVAAATFTDVHAALFPETTSAKCDSCHGQPASQISNGLLNMGRDDRAAAYAALMNAKSTSRDCAGRAFVVPGDPEGSLLFIKLTGAPQCGERMPLGGGALPAAQLELVRSWIAGGALDD